MRTNQKLKIKLKIKLKPKLEHEFECLCERILGWVFK